jgi:hypothetical protein
VQFAVRDQARYFRAGAGAAGGAIVRFAGTQDEILGMGGQIARRPEQFDMIDLGPVRAGDPLPF